MNKNLVIGILLGTTTAEALAVILLLNNSAYQTDKYKKLWDMSRYVAAKAREEGVEFTEFDLIAMRELGFGSGSQIEED